MNVNDVSFPPQTTHQSPVAKDKKAGLKKWLTVGKALAHIPEPENAPNIPNHEYSKYKLRFNGHLGHRRIDPDLPAPTVTGRGDEKGGVVVLHHPNNHRRMSARELAAVQSFPDSFVFEGTRTSAYRQIANAVPPKLGLAIGKMLTANGVLIERELEAADDEPTKPFPTYKWRWLHTQPTESRLKLPVYKGVLRAALNSQGLAKSSVELFNELSKVETDPRRRNSTNDQGGQVELARDTARNILRNSGQYWTGTGVLVNVRGKVELTSLGQKFAGGALTNDEFAALMVRNTVLPNPQTYSDAEIAKWRDAGLRIKPFE